jgi:hypothetical protein
MAKESNPQHLSIKELSDGAAIAASEELPNDKYRSRLYGRLGDRQPRSRRMGRSRD